MSMTWLEAVDTIRTARNQAAGKPLQNNTRLYMRGEGDEREFGIVLHDTEVVTIHADDTYTLRAGGYRTNTTLDRIRNYSPMTWQTLLTESGDWYVRLEPNPDDPRPEHVKRSIPKPYTPGDWRDEPVKSTEDCKAGQMVTTEHVDELVEIYRRDMRDGDEIVQVISDGFGDDGKYDRLKVKRTWTDHVYYSEQRYWDEGWANLMDNRDVHRDSFINDDGERVRKIQCPHCAEFEARHEVWHVWMHGPRYHRRFDGPDNGYAIYRQMMDRFHDDKDLWQAAYIEDFRARRDYLKADREWDQRNRVPFYDGIRVDSEGYAPRVRQEGPSPAKLRRHEAAVKKMKKRIEKYLDGYIKALVKGMPMPGNGDCWYCLLRDTKTGETWGDMGNHDHLLSHMEDRYYVPTLAVNALREKPVTDIGIYLLLDMNQDTNRMGGKPQGKAPYDEAKRALRAYMIKRLVPEAPTS
jgi:hypothetical protein